MIDKLISLLDWIYKKKCYFCKSSFECVKMCSKCYDKLSFRLFRPERIIEGVNIYCAGNYTKELQKLIRGLKYHRQKDLAHYLAKFMYEYFQKLNIEGEFEIVPVPLHKNRQKKRKYNHMELAAEEFALMSGFSVNFDIIKRVKDTKPQYRLTRKERLENLSNAFEVDRYKYRNKKLLVIDDICTTGSTFEEIIREFKKNGICDIICLAAATPL